MRTSRILRLVASAFLASGSALAADPAPAVPQDPSPLKTLRFGGQIRLRAEGMDLKGYKAADRVMQDFVFLRTRLWGQAEPGRGLKVHLEVQDSRTFGGEASVTSNEKNLDLRQGFVEVKDLFEKPVDLKAGRFAMAFGDERLVGALDWSNTGRHFDGVKIAARGGSWNADLFWTLVREVSDFNDENHFWGLYSSVKAFPDHVLDAFAFLRDYNDATQVSETDLLGAATRGNLSDRTLGTRFKGKASGFDYSAEGAYQFGRKAGQPVRAYGLAVVGGCTFGSRFKPRLGFEYDYGSGDSSPSDRRIQTFDPLFPTGHSFQGSQDIFSWKNGSDFKTSLSGQLFAGWSGQVDHHYFLLAHRQDAWYDAAGTTIVRDASGRSGREIGHEVDLAFKGKVRDAVGVASGWSHFFTGSFPKFAAIAAHRDWVFLQATLDF